MTQLCRDFSDFENKVYTNNNELHFDWISQNIIKCQKILNNKVNHLNIFKTHTYRAELYAAQWICTIYWILYIFLYYLLYFIRRTHYYV